MSAERDEEVFQLVSKSLSEGQDTSHELTKELLAIARKWRSKAIMREHRIIALQES